MHDSFILELSSLDIVDNLWPQFVERIGFERSKQAVHQALDLQLMNGNKETLPVLLFETCGLALVSIDNFYSKVGIFCSGPGTVLILSIKRNCAQLIGEK
tara:strand:+ start:159 stop:458 length:300 start_codon:yes stop_codon:yes gene_type:complete